MRDGQNAEGGGIKNLHTSIMLESHSLRTCMMPATFGLEDEAGNKPRQGSSSAMSHDRDLRRH
jgi:hypothetical protein